MSSSPVNDADGAENDEGWRASVAQSYRSTEVREIAKVLASLEPGATASSKLMLAMRFEDTIFNQSTSLADYRKRLAKRLKKLTKNYVAAPPSTTAAGGTEQRLQALKRKYGERLLFIVQNADKAISLLSQKTDSKEKAVILKQHTKNAQQWATDLGLLAGTTLNLGMDTPAVDKMALHLEQRVDNIRAHVVKLSEPDIFLEETLETLETKFKDTSSEKLAASLNRLKRLGWTEFDHPETVVKDSFEKVQQVIPLPTRDATVQREAALHHLDRLRSASQAVLAYLDIPNKAAASIPRAVLSKSYASAVQSIDFLSEVTPQLVGKSEGDHTQIQLQDAWTKVLEMPADSVSSSLEPSAKRRRTMDYGSGIVMKSRVLLTPGRKPPSNLLQELNRKGAQLVRPLPNGEGSHLIVKFGDAFVMTIYLVPLLVTLRAASKNDDWTSSSSSWTSPQTGLEGREELQVWGVTGTSEQLGHVVEAQLRYASANATHVLRTCFSNTTKAKNDFEVEISEGTALLQFLQLARTTYMGQQD